jgi:hypothetical protein
MNSLQVTSFLRLAFPLAFAVIASGAGADATAPPPRLFVMSSDPTIFNDALDPWLLLLYAFGWLGVFGTALTLRAAVQFWRKGIGRRWSRVHHAQIAASNAMLAWFFLTFHIAGTTLNY